MLRLLPILLLIVSLSGLPALADGDAGQPRPVPLDERVEQEVREMVGAKGGLMSSWGAYYAGKYRLVGLVPDLLALVARENARPENFTPLVRKAALDALVRLDAEVPAEVLLARPDAICLPETLILLARDPETNRDALLRLMDVPPIEGEHHWAAAFLLAPDAPPGLARRLLADVRLRLDVTARDPGDDALIMTGFGGGSGIWGGTRGPFPPRPTYSFHLQAKRGDVALRGGALPLYARRTEGRRSGRTAPKAREMRRSELAVRCLGVLLQKDLGKESKVRTVGIEWQDDASFGAAVEAERSRLRGYWSALVEELRERGHLLPDEELTTELPIKVQIHDRRKVKEPPLPE